MTINCNYYRVTTNCDSVNAGDKRRRLRSVACAYVSPDPDRIALASHAEIADFDIVIARGEIEAGRNADCDVAVAICVLKERHRTNRRVVGAGVAAERDITDGRVLVAGFVGMERVSTNGRVFDAVSLLVSA